MDASWRNGGLNRMLRNYFAAALRNLLRNRAYGVINICGLALGFAAVILIALYVRDEYSYDRFFPNYERIFKVDQTVVFPGRPALMGSQTFSDIGPALQLDFPAIDMTATVRGRDLRVDGQRDPCTGRAGHRCPQVKREAGR